MATAGRLLSEVKITDMASLAKAVAVLHERYGVPHIIITSVDLDRNDGGDATPSLSVVGSTMTSDRKARPFKIVFPRINCYFSGTGDMFAALTVVRMREVIDATEGGRLRTSPSWLSPDDVEAVDLPLARAAEKVLASMHEVLTRTRENMIRAVEGTTAVDGETAPPSTGVDAEKRKHLLKSKAAELRLVRHLNSLREPEVEFRAQPL